MILFAILGTVSTPIIEVSKEAVHLVNLGGNTYGCLSRRSAAQGQHFRMVKVDGTIKYSGVGQTGGLLMAVLKGSKWSIIAASANSSRTLTTTKLPQISKLMLSATNGTLIEDADRTVYLLMQKGEGEHPAPIALQLKNADWRAQQIPTWLANVDGSDGRSVTITRYSDSDRATVRKLRIGSLENASGWDVLHEASYGIDPESSYEGGAACRSLGIDVGFIRSKGKARFISVVFPRSESLALPAPYDKTQLAVDKLYARIILTGTKSAVLYNSMGKAVQIRSTLIGD